MSKKRSRKHRAIKRLKYHNHNYHQSFQNLPRDIINNNLFIKSKYNKYFDYPLSELLVDHSTDPMQNTARQYVSSHLSNEGRFMNHEMIIRRNGESTIHRPKYDIVLDNGFTRIIQPSYLLSSYQSLPFHSQIASSSVINKMSVEKSKVKRLNKRKHKCNKNEILKITVEDGLRDIVVIKKENNLHQKRIPFQDLSSKYSDRNTTNNIEYSYNLPTIEDSVISKKIFKFV
ncbi:unnamed protein product [Adineta steineri]|uniref:Uncharacterized protein n=1 Tax=Adineta steineri TaxID=433720 RepID=A0A814CMB2_9BILA|nr:unnamed protein product [Adineta steineri]CAF0958569.1 unnamed protein product [Adineta steineri]CAF3630921.1 unnamed protein product [Adineta steineri]CAF3686866.1 unnamed protein product [Adineta steineri]CAF3811732.1 unnamed protein product [Adineta steineri]